MFRKKALPMWCNQWKRLFHWEPRLQGWPSTSGTLQDRFLYPEEAVPHNPLFLPQGQVQSVSCLFITRWSKAVHTLDATRGHEVVAGTAVSVPCSMSADWSCLDVFQPDHLIRCLVNSGSRNMARLATLSKL